MNTKIAPGYHIDAIKNKLNTYLDRNGMIHRKYFTPYSLIIIIEYFVKSRISYGLCCFLDNPSSMKRLEDVLARHLKSIFGLPSNTSHRRMLAEIKMRLAVRLLKNWHKYKENFGEFPTLYEPVLLRYFDRTDLYPERAGEVDFRALRDKLISENIRESAKEFLPVEIRDKHRDFLKKHVFSWYDLRNWHVIRYFTHTTKGTNARLFPICGCGAANTPDHGANHCTEILKNRDKIVRDFDALFVKAGLPKRKKLFEYMHAVYFSIDKVPDKGCVRKLIELMKSTIVQLVLNDNSKDGRLLRAQIEAANEHTVEAAIEKLNAAEKSEVVRECTEDSKSEIVPEDTVVESTDSGDY